MSLTGNRKGVRDMLKQIWFVGEANLPPDLERAYFDKKFFTDENSAEWAAERYNWNNCFMPCFSEVKVFSAFIFVGDNPPEIT
jgi:hypothetical protein